jgi:hypothetical protein
MGRFMIPVCCICGRKAERFDDSRWRYQDFCPECVEVHKPLLECYISDEEGK